MGERIKATVAVFVFLTKDSSVYLQRRYNTGYLDGFYDTPSGKVDKNESALDAACREAQEEAGVVLKQDDLELFHSYLNNQSADQPWLGLMFRTGRWESEPIIAEPDKCDDAGFFELDSLPKVTPQVLDGLGRVTVGSHIKISYYPPGSLPV